MTDTGAIDKDFLKTLEKDVARGERSAKLIARLKHKGPSLISDVMISLHVFGHPFAFRRYTKNLGSAVLLVAGGKRAATVHVDIYTKEKHPSLKTHANVTMPGHGNFSHQGEFAACGVCIAFLLSNP